MKRLLFSLTFLIILSMCVVSVFAQKKTISAKIPAEVVEFGKTSILSDGNGAFIEWNTDDEFNNLGFNVYRISVENKERVLINSSIVLGTALTTGDKQSGGTYSLFDADGNLESTYIIEAISVGGENKLSAPIYVTYVNDLGEKAQQTSQLASDLSSRPESRVESNTPIIPKDLVTRNAINSPSTAQTTQFWVASQNAAKIGIKQNGVYRVSRSQLQTAGFDVNASTSLWQLYADGVEQSIIVEPNGNFIEFYGQGLDTLSTDTRTYYLVVGTQNGRRIPSFYRRNIRERIVSRNFESKFERSDNQTYLSSLLNGDADNFFGAVFNNSPINLTLNVPAVDTVNSGSARLDLRVQGLTNTPHSVSVLLNGQQIGTLTGNNTGSMNLVYNLSSQTLLTGNNVVQLVSANSNDYCLFDKVSITYPKRYVSSGNRLSFSTPNYKTAKIEGFSTPNIRLFDLTETDNPSIIGNVGITQNGATYDLTVSSNKTRMMYAITDESLLTPFSVVANIPSNLSSVSKQANFVIISHKSLITQANDWATYRRNQGMLVEVIDVEDVFDEFGFGEPDPDAIKNFFGYAKNSWLVKPNYTLLIGDTTYDQRNYQGSSAPYNLVPSKLVDTSYSETVSDEYLVDFNDDGLAELAIGRIPMITAAGVTSMLNKTIAFELTRSTAMQRGALFVSDLPNGYDFEGVNSRLRQVLPATMPATMVSRSQVDGRAQIISSADSGKFLINYSGHGSVSFWAASAFYHRDDAFAMNNGNNLTIFTLLTCLNGFFHNNATDSFAEGALKAPNGGAVATWASTGLTTPDVQEVMATRYYQKIADGSIERIGDLIKDAKTTLIYGRDVRLSWALLGDPTLRVR